MSAAEPGPPLALAEQILAETCRLGFDLAAIVPAGPPSTAHHFQAWLERGYQGEMAYLARPDALAKRLDPGRILPGLRSAVVVAANYAAEALPAAAAGDPTRGQISRYAWGDDYHDLLLPRLRQLGAWLEAQTGAPVAQRAYVDTGPILERDLAARAGLGFVGKNTHLIHPRLGSWLFLGELLLGLDLPPARSARNLAGAGDAAQGTCGGCTRCLEACPTAALVAPHVLDARRCIAYLTIELQGPIPPELRPGIGQRIFGCDVCQAVCPWNRRFARPSPEPAFAPRPGAEAPPLLELMALDEAGFQARFRGSAVLRARRRGLLRNVAVALGNWGDPLAVPALARALADPEALIRGHAAWALGRIGGGPARAALEQALATEAGEWVRAELQAALCPSGL